MGYHFCSCDFEVNQTKIKGGCQSRRKVVPHDSKSDLPLVRSLSLGCTYSTPDSQQTHHAKHLSFFDEVEASNRNEYVPSTPICMYMPHG